MLVTTTVVAAKIPRLCGGGTLAISLAGVRYRAWDAVRADVREFHPKRGTRKNEQVARNGTVPLLLPAWLRSYSVVNSSF